MAVSLALAGMAGVTMLAPAGYAHHDPLHYVNTQPSVGLYLDDVSSYYPCAGSASYSGIYTGTGLVRGGTAQTSCPESPAGPQGVAVTAQAKLYKYKDGFWVLVASGPKVTGTDSVSASVEANCDGPFWYVMVGYHTADYNGDHAEGTTSSATMSGCSPPKPCDPETGAPLMIEHITAIFGSGFNNQTVRDGLPSLDKEMKAAGINNPARCAAFLATLKHESGLKYNADQAATSSTYRGRGFIQLTGKPNYQQAGASVGHDFVAQPGDVAALGWSAQVVRWYWTVARPNSNTAADNLDMGLISRYIGYSNKVCTGSGPTKTCTVSNTEDLDRCADFKNAYEYLSGSPTPASVVCIRH